MVARIAGGSVVGWLLGLAPLIVINVISLKGGAIDPSTTAIAGALGLALGVALGGLAAGLIGGRRSGLFAGPIAGLLFAGSLTALMYWLNGQGRLPVLIAAHPIRTMGALLFLGAIIAGLAVGVAALLSWRASSIEERQNSQAIPASRAQPAQRPVSAPRPANPYAPYEQYDQRAAPPTRRMERVERDFTPDLRRGAPNSAGSVTRATPDHSAGRGATRYDKGYDKQERWPEAPGRW